MHFDYTPVIGLPGIMMPRMNLILAYSSRSMEVLGLVDSGSTVNVLPYSAGLQLGAVWDDHPVQVQLVGNLARFEARALRLFAYHPDLNPTRPVKLVFAWTRAENAPVIFGQTNFFTEFDVCFFKSAGFFEVNLKATE